MFLEEKDDLFRKIMPTEDFSRLLKKLDNDFEVFRKKNKKIDKKSSQKEKEEESKISYRKKTCQKT